MRVRLGLWLERLCGRPWALGLAAGGAYLLLSLLLLAPTLPSFGRAVPGGLVAAADGWQNVWNLWWFHRAVTTGLNPFFTRMIFYPEGADLLGQTLTCTNGLLLLPVTALFGPVAGYNAAVLLSFVLAGMGGYALTLHVTGRPLAAFVGGCVFTFAPFHLTKVWDGQLELSTLQWLPFYLLFLLRCTAGDGRWRDAAAAGVLLAIVGYTSWYYLFFAALASLLVAALWLPYRAGARVWLLALARLAAAATLAVLLIAPALPSLLGSATELAGPSASAALLPLRSATLLDFWLPSNLHPVWGAWAQSLGAVWHADIAAWNVALGYTPLALALVALVRMRGAAWRWLVLAGAACVLALGPTLNIGPWKTGLPLPYAALAALPGGNISHRPSHFVVITCVALAPLAGLGLNALLARTAVRWRGWLLAGVLLALTWEFLPPRWNLWAPTPHPYYDVLANQPGALLVLPAAAEDLRPLIDQMRHGRPLMGGLLARAPSYDPPQAPGMRELWRPEAGPLWMLPTVREDALTTLNYYGVTQIVIERTRMQPGEAAALDSVLAWLLLDAPLRYEDARLRVFQVPAAPPRGFAFFRTGWYPEEADGKHSWRWMRARGEIMLVNPSAVPWPVAVQLGVESYLNPRALDLAVDGAALGRWTIPAQPRHFTRIMHLLLPPGEHRLLLQAPLEAELAPSNRHLGIVLTDITVRYHVKE